MPHQAAAALSSLLTQPDLLGVIFGSLPTNTRLGSIPTVCKQFQEAARHCPPTAVTLRLESHLDAAYKARLFNSWVHQVDTRHITYLQVSYGSHISCYVSRPRAYGTDYLPPLPFAALRGLRSLDLHGPILTPYDAVHLQGLTSLRASQSCGSCAAMTVALLTNLQQLELVIHGDHNRHQQLTSIQAVADLASPWVELGNRLNKLTGLTLRIDPCMLGNAIVTMLSGLTSLQHLVLDDCTMTIEVLEEFGSGFGHLTRLGITFPTPPDSWSNSPPTSRLGSALDLVALSGLQQISLSNLAIDNPSPLSALTNLTSLSAFNWIFNTPAAAGIFLARVLPHMTALRHLSMVYTTWPYQTPPALFGKIARLPQLQSLQLLAYDGHDRRGRVDWQYEPPQGAAGLGLFAVPESMQALQELMITSSVFESPADINALTLACPNLTKLHIESLLRPISTANSITALTALIQLKDVKLEVFGKPRRQQPQHGGLGQVGGAVAGAEVQQPGLWGGLGGWDDGDEQQDDGAELSAAAAEALHSLLALNEH